MAKVKIYVTSKEGILDPQGKAVEASLHSLGYRQVSNVKIGKYIELEIEIKDPAKRDEIINEMCRKLLANPVIEDYRYEIAD